MQLKTPNQLALNIILIMKNANHYPQLVNNKHQKQKTMAPSKLNDDQQSFLLALFANPNLCSTSSIRLFPHPTLIRTLFTQPKPIHKSKSHYNKS
jgi:hypothetical protein